MTLPSEQDRAQGRIGTWIRGKYRIDGVLGVGGMAVVFKATHRNDAEFAIKMLHPELSLREDVRTRFLREGKAANGVKHSGVVMVVDDDVAEDGAAFLVMELLDGAPCDSLLEKKRGAIPVKAACAIAHQMLDVLAAAHGKGIIHRDIKPANVFALRDGRIKLLDFGIARVRDAAASGAQATGSGMLLGTPAFMPPEQALGKTSEIDATTDVWAVGATIFTLTTGHLVHDGDNASQILVAAATRPARSLSTLAANAPPSVVAVVDRALAFERRDRWQSAAEMRDALAEAYRAAFGENISPEPVRALLAAPVDPALARTEHLAPPVSIKRNPQATLPLERPSDGGTLRAGAQPVVAVSEVPNVPLVGMSTSQPISSDKPSIPGAKAGWSIPAVVIGVVVVGLVFTATKLVTGESTASAPIASAEASSASVSSPIVPAATNTAPPQVSITPTISSPPAVATVATSSARVLLNPPINTTNKPAAKPDAAAPPSATATAKAPSCHLVESVDAQGAHHFQNVCE